MTTFQTTNTLDSILCSLSALRYQCQDIAENFDDDASLPEVLIKENLTLCVSVFDEIFKKYFTSDMKVRLMRTSVTMLRWYISDLIFYVDCEMCRAEIADEKLAQKIAIIHGILLSCKKIVEKMPTFYVEKNYYEVTI